MAEGRFPGLRNGIHPLFAWGKSEVVNLERWGSTWVAVLPWPVPRATAAKAEKGAADSNARTLAVIGSRFPIRESPNMAGNCTWQTGRTRRSIALIQQIRPPGSPYSCTGNRHLGVAADDAGNLYFAVPTQGLCCGRCRPDWRVGLQRDH